MKKVAACILILLLLAGTLGGAATAAPGKSETKRSIAIVFDNSGSMYEQQNPAWCRATYATEVFAAMMNEGDTMTIYPMHPVEIGGKTYTSDSPVVISGPRDAETVRRIYTPDAGGTPIETIDAAYASLLRSDGEQWLIVLTDGAEFYENDRNLGGETSAKLTERLGRYNDSVNVMYLGIGAEAAMPSLSGGRCLYFGDKADDSTQVLSKLTYMCNMIFGRDTMDITGSDVSIDVSMKKMIFFVQGRSVSDIAVTGEDGQEIGKRVDEHATRFSELGAGGVNAGNTSDDNLQGLIVTYENCRAGDARLAYTGDASSIAAYYEPDVDLVVQLVDEATGQVVSGSEVAYAGDYTLRYGLIDNQSGELTESPLLGSTHYEVDYTVNGETFTAVSDEKHDALSLTLAAGDVLDATISADYLSGYHLEKSGPDFGWPEAGFRIEVRAIDPEKLSFELTGGQADYPLSQLEELGHYTMKASYDGQPLEGELLGTWKPQLALTGGNAGADFSPNGDKSGYDVRLLYNEDPIHTDAGEYALEYNVAYTNEDGQTGSGVQKSLSFTVTNDGFGLRADLERKQSYYQLSKLEEGEPLILHLSKDGVPLTDEELADVKLTVDAGGIPCETEMLPGESAYAIRLKAGDGIATGSHTVACRAESTDSLGQPIEGSDKTSVEIQKYPAWLRTAIILLAILLLLLLIWLYLNSKILPKRIMVSKTIFTVDGEAITGKASSTYSGGGKKKGTLEVHSPKCPTNPMAKCGFMLELKAYSPRRVRSSARLATVTDVRAINGNNVSGVRIGTVQFMKESGGKLTRSGARKNAPTEFQIGNKKQCVVTGEVLDPNGGTASISLVVTLSFS